jgi:hypothetical protein
MTIREHLDKLHQERAIARELAENPQRKFVDLDRLLGTPEEAIARHKKRLAAQEGFTRGPGRPRRKR